MKFVVGADYKFKDDLQKLLDSAEKTGYDLKDFVVYDCGNLRMGTPFDLGILQVITPTKYQPKCPRKPLMILDAFDKHNDILVYFDADIEIQEKFNEVFTQDYDIGVTILPSWFHTGEFDDNKTYAFASGFLNAGVVFINPTPQAREFIQKWIEEIPKTKLGSDQEALTRLVKRAKPSWRYNEVCKLEEIRIKLFDFAVYNWHARKGVSNRKAKIIHHVGFAGKKYNRTYFDNPELKEFYEREFDFGHQYKNTFDDWVSAFERSVARRAVDGCFIGLSSGYDSGVLSCELYKQGVDFKAWTFINGENMEIINQRKRFLKEHEASDLSGTEYEGTKKHLEGKIENSKYIIIYDGVETKQRILDDKASIGLGAMCNKAVKEGRKTYLSTQGADEIISDYSLFPSQSTFKGVFPDPLYEWDNFRQGCNYSYLMKEERVPKVFGVETRYPFLDVDLVQEFLWLSPRLKNLYYKAPLHYYLVKNLVPFEAGIKRGFTPR